MKLHSGILTNAGLALTLAATIWTTQALATSSVEELSTLARTAKEVCSTPAQSGSEWTFKSSGGGGAELSLKRLPKAGVNGTLSFSKTEYEGIQRARPEQQVESDKVRNSCVQYITELLVQKLKASPSLPLGAIRIKRGFDVEILDGNAKISAPRLKDTETPCTYINVYFASKSRNPAKFPCVIEGSRQTFSFRDETYQVEILNISLDDEYTDVRVTKSKS